MHISRLFIYPVKSCAPVEVQSFQFDTFGPRGDRRFMLVDLNGKFLSQRQLPAMAHIHPAIQWRDDGQMDGLLLSCKGHGDFLLELGDMRKSVIDVRLWDDVVAANDCGDAVAQWFSAVLQRDCRLVLLPVDSQRQVSLKRAEPGRYVGFADGYPLLVVSQATLDYLSRQVGRDVRVERFRPNVVVKGDHQAFDELQWQKLQSEGGYMALVKPCERCVIPTRDLMTLEREADVLDVLKNEFRINGKIIFGQNAIDYDMEQLSVGDVLTAC